MTKHISQSQHVSNAHYELRGRLTQAANALQAKDKHLLKLHLGNPGLFNLTAAEELIKAITDNLTSSQAYCDSKGLMSARLAIQQHARDNNLAEIKLDHIMIGNGVSELINFSLQALLNPGDEVLLPQPVYPLWSAATTLHGGQVYNYRCNKDNWLPDIDHLASQISSKTKALVVINPNNPTGSVYPREILEAIAALAAQHNLVLFADEIYSEILYDDTPFHYCASLDHDALIISFHGLSKNYLLAGYRCAWLTASGATDRARGYLDGIAKLMSMRLCANVPAQHAIATALQNPQYGFLQRYPEMVTKRNRVIAALNNIEGLSCHRPQGAFYAYPQWDAGTEVWDKDEDWVLDFLTQEQVLLAPGSTFAQPDQRHFRLVLLPDEADCLLACEKLQHFMQARREQSHLTPQSSFT